MNPQTAIQRMQFNISAARELARCGLLTAYMRGHYSGVLATYTREADTTEVIALNHALQEQLEQMDNQVADMPTSSRLFNPNDFFCRHQGLTLVLIAVLAIGVPAI